MIIINITINDKKKKKFLNNNACNFFVVVSLLNHLLSPQIKIYK